MAPEGEALRAEGAVEIEAGEVWTREEVVYLVFRWVAVAGAACSFPADEGMLP